MEGERLPTIDELAAAVVARDGEPAARLDAAIELGRELADVGDALIGRFVAEARTAGLEILRRLGVTPDQVHAALAVRMGVEPQLSGPARRRRRRLLAPSR